jgi:hypothetical protein
MAKQSVTPRFGSPRFGSKGRRSSSSPPASSTRSRAQGVLLEFIGEAPSKEGLARGTKLVMRGRLDCHDRPYLRVSPRPGQHSAVLENMP